MLQKRDVTHSQTCHTSSDAPKERCHPLPDLSHFLKYSVFFQACRKDTELLCVDQYHTYSMLCFRNLLYNARRLMPNNSAARLRLFSAMASARTTICRSTSTNGVPTSKLIFV